jgi:uncharacterized protein with FMN-binding domain
MRRALLTLGGTAAGLAALLSFKTHSLAAADPAASTPATPAVSATSATPAVSAGTSQPMASGTGSSSASQARTVTGTAASTPYGPMQVQLTLAGAKITKVTVVQRTNVGTESNQIDSNAIPTLTRETLAAQSAKIDAVSGASYTSSGYIRSLQSALDQAGSG